MKILLISPSIYPLATGGMEIYNYYFIEELKELGEEVSLLSNHSGHIQIDIPQYRLYTRNSFLQSIQIFFHLIFHKYDIVHIPYCSNSFLAKPLGLFKIFFKKNDYVIYIHGGGMHEWKEPDRQTLFFKKAKIIISVSDPIKNEYQNRSERSITTILPLIPYKEPKRTRKEIRELLRINNDEKVMIYVGSIKPIKGSDFLINSFVRLGKDFLVKNNLRILFIGDGILRKELEDLVRQNSLQDRIIFFGKKKKEEVSDYLGAADIFIFASHYEGTPLALLDAMHNKLLVISSNVTGINNIIQHQINGLLYTRDDFYSFKKTLEFALKNNDDCEKMKKHAKEITLKNYNYKENFLQHLKLYAER